MAYYCGKRDADLVEMISGMLFTTARNLALRTRQHVARKNWVENMVYGLLLPAEPTHRQVDQWTSGPVDLQG